jgi:prepilin-type N-terminal cleavage/methylation domain-containing protein/prepilin-type processing-associated H-X9-DG protein
MRRAFTLIEFLVVIAIIALIAAMLLPAIQIVRETSFQTRCASNLRQLGMGVHMYTNDHSGWLPQVIVQNVPTDPGGIWFDDRFVGKYLERPETGELSGIIKATEMHGILRCPASRRQRSTWGGSGTVYGNYGYNSGLVGYINGSWGSWQNTRVASLLQAGNRVMIVDGIDFAFNPGGWISNSDTNPAPAGAYDERGIAEGGINPGWTPMPTPWLSQWGQTMAANRHRMQYTTVLGQPATSGTTNMVFVDGHVRATTDTMRESRELIAFFQRGR